MKKPFLNHLFCVVMTVFCIRCSGLTVDEPVQDSGQSETEEKTEQEADQQLNTEPDTNMDGDPSTQGSSTTVGNPAYEIENISTDSILISNADANDDVVVQGSIADYDSSYGVAVVNSTQYAMYQEQQNTFLAKLNQKLEHFILSLRGPKGRGNPVMPVAWADTSGCFTDNSYITEITMNADGTIDPQAISNYNSGDELKIFYFDTTTCETGTESAVDVIENLLYVAQTAAGSGGIAADSAGNINQTDASGNVVNIAASEEEGFVVQNNFDINYVMASLGSSVSALAYNTSASDFIFQSSELVSAYDYADGLFTSVTDSNGICANANGCLPVGMKVKGEKSYYIIEYDESVDAKITGTIYELYDNETQYIRFLDGNIDEDGRLIKFRSAKAFDVVVDGDGDPDNTLVVFEDGNGSLRLHGVNQLATRNIIGIELTEISNITDLIIYSAQPFDDVANGSAFLTTDSGIYFIDYDFINSMCEEEEIEEGDCDNPDGDGTSLSVDTTNPISIVNLVSVVVNDAGTFAYALADDTITVINLSSHETEKTIALSDVIGKHIEFSASALLYTSIGENDYLVVSSDSLKSAIVVDLSQEYSATATTYYINSDGNGYGSSTSESLCVSSNQRDIQKPVMTAMMRAPLFTWVPQKLKTTASIRIVTAPMRRVPAPPTMMVMASLKTIAVY